MESWNRGDAHHRHVPLLPPTSRCPTTSCARRSTSPASARRAATGSRCAGSSCGTRPPSRRWPTSTCRRGRPTSARSATARSTSARCPDGAGRRPLRRALRVLPVLVVACAELAGLHATDAELGRRRSSGAGRSTPPCRTSCLALRDQGVGTAFTTLLCTRSRRSASCWRSRTASSRRATSRSATRQRPFPTKLARSPVEEIVGFADSPRCSALPLVPRPGAPPVTDAAIAQPGDDSATSCAATRAPSRDKVAFVTYAPDAAAEHHLRRARRARQPVGATCSRRAAWAGGTSSRCMARNGIPSRWPPTTARSSSARRSPWSTRCSGRTRSAVAARARRADRRGRRPEFVPPIDRVRRSPRCWSSSATRGRLGVGPELLAAGDPEPDCEVDENDVAMLVYTLGHHRDPQGRR